MVALLIVVQAVAGSIPVSHPICYPHANRGSFEPHSCEGFSCLEMLEYIRYVQKCANIRPKTYWWEIPFYKVVSGGKRRFCFGYRPEDLAHLDTIEQKAWKTHEAYLNRLERFPLDKAEYYQRLKEVHAVNTVRGLSKVTGEDWSYIAKVLRILAPDFRYKFQKSKNTLLYCKVL